MELMISHTKHNRVGARQATRREGKACGNVKDELSRPGNIRGKEGVRLDRAAVGANAYNPSTWEAKAGQLQIQT